MSNNYSIFGKDRCNEHINGWNESVNIVEGLLQQPVVDAFCNRWRPVVLYVQPAVAPVTHSKMDISAATANNKWTHRGPTNAQRVQRVTRCD